MATHLVFLTKSDRLILRNDNIKRQNDESELELEIPDGYSQQDIVENIDALLVDTTLVDNEGFVVPEGYNDHFISLEHDQICVMWDNISLEGKRKLFEVFRVVK